MIVLLAIRTMQVLEGCFRIIMNRFWTSLDHVELLPFLLLRYFAISIAYDSHSKIPRWTFGLLFFNTL
jgi:hypothetical protein